MRITKFDQMLAPDSKGTTDKPNLTVDPFEVNPARINIFLHFFSSNTEGKLSMLLDKQGLAHDEVQAASQRKEWLPAALESNIITKLCEHYQSWDWLFESGREAFNRTYTHLLPLQHEDLDIRQVLTSIPSIYSYFSNTCHINIGGLDQNHFRVTVRPSLTGADLAVELMFVCGLLEAVLSLFHAKDASINLEQSTLPAKTAQTWAAKLNQAEKTIWGNGIDAFLVYLPNLDLKARSMDGAADLYLNEPGQAADAVMQTVLTRSRELLKDKRELMTAVEYLHAANDELERTIMATQKEMQMAKSIQEGILPQSLPEWRGLRFAVEFLPMREVSGDYYDFLKLGGDKLGVLVGDVSGHGVPAALIAIISKVAFLNHKLDSPKETFSRVNKELLDYVKGEGFMTAIYLVFDSDRVMRYASAGAPFPLVYRRQTRTLSPLVARGTILGVFDDAHKNLTEDVTELQPGDRVYIYTDGIVEGVNTDDKPFGEERLRKAIRDTIELSVAESLAEIKRRFEEFTLGTKPQDDITLLAVELDSRTDVFEQHLGFARDHARAKEYPDALHHYRQALEIFPNHSLALFLAGRAAIHNHKYRLAIQYLEKYNSFRPYNADSYSLLGIAYSQILDTDKAVRYFDQSLQIRSENPQALFGLTQTYLQMGHPVKAKECVDRLEKQRPDHKQVKALRNKLSKLFD